MNVTPGKEDWKSRDLSGPWQIYILSVIDCPEVDTGRLDVFHALKVLLMSVTEFPVFVGAFRV
jgi:hypothetical protein